LPSKQPSNPITTGIRRAIDADAPAIAAILPQAATSQGAVERATFVLDDADSLIGVLVLSQSNDRLWIEAIAVSPDRLRRGHGKTLMAFAEAAAREIGLRTLAVRTTDSAVFFASLGFVAEPAGMVKRLRGGALARAMQHLEAVGVPLFGVGSAPPGRTLYYRCVWIGFALLIGLGSLSLAASNSDALTLGRIVFAVVLSATGVLFALWQSWLMVSAPLSIVTKIGGATAVLAIAFALYGKAAPEVLDVISTYRNDAHAGDLRVISDGPTLMLKGMPGKDADTAVRRALEDNPAIREVVLEGGGDRLAPAYEIYRLIHNHRLATHVDHTCAAACVLMFLGGVDRSISANAILSFRQAGSPGMDRVRTYERNQQLEKLLAVQAGLSPLFVQRVLATAPDSVWTPTIDELLAGRVIQRVRPTKEQAK
jgi:N-acetylglutamate synthase-like GNAT family acetyltransferase